ncbi:purine-nucleoside phosphorylase [Bariatricus massiliensis]|uniref:Purine nucleoside phosphorylase n=1 Tax=Bariatricus massiliensis TaxID=1745713 RepID=A0ABS8DBN0_9FIRM|nr:purine-nucleoside phosphorylase [Bariatricus massiliensis]MCB7303730.1 purine-nucleoside phosphorylase [Bariatricus massiliensis]MCB7373146.1 purine-nucleoside phosphorylase [Bariatricus massiliensis]MCB7385816.1 purine-nucleoside phosphorylase [Bariatricus massiliensis]MCB7409978.1 purine-nucleoside phosphorylase [Bariatricus massiliensis]MCQ5253054.1 purine-nucleoside phosphorylase [Bariatricus massiliensis]
MKKEYEMLKRCCEYCRTKTDFIPRIGLVLGSGLGDFAKCVQVECEIPYKDIPGFPVSTVAGHDGRYIFGWIEDVPVVLMKGRVHYYEGYSMEEVVRPIRLLKLFGVEILFLTNAAGGINLEFSAGDFMLITDQISQFIPSPLRGTNLEEMGARFPDMSEIYNKELCDIIRQTAKAEQINLKEGVYIQFPGPNFESPAEVRMAGILGADAVGMSTACEGIAARHMGMKTCGISCVVNMGCGIQKTPLNHEEVQAMGRKRAPEFQRLVRQSILSMGK